MKKFFSILLAAALFACCLAPSAFAEEAVQFAVSSAEGTTGDEVTIEVSVENAELTTYGLQLTWDKAALELVKLEKGDAVLGNFFANPANGMVTDAGNQDQILDGVICVATFKILAVESGEFEVGVEVDNVTKADLTSLESVVEAGYVKVTVVCEHEWDEGVVTIEPDCEEVGEMTYTCQKCGETYTEEIPALGHDWDEGVVTVEPDCEEKGEMTYTCQRCGETKTEDIPALGHNYEDGVCTNCGKKKPSGITKPEGPYYDDNGEEVKLPFTDVNVSDWFYGDVLYVYANGLMNGTSATTFSPYGVTTRGQIVTILYRLEGAPAVAGACPFTDVAAGTYYEDAITWAAANGVVTGYDATTFGPDDQITREQMAAILYRYALNKGIAAPALTDNLAAFSDAANISGYAVEAMNWAVGQGLLNGMGDGTVAPQGQAIRAQAAAILHRFCETLELI